MTGNGDGGGDEDVVFSKGEDVVDFPQMDAYYYYYYYSFAQFFLYLY